MRVIKEEYKYACDPMPILNDMLKFEGVTYKDLGYRYIPTYLNDDLCDRLVPIFGQSVVEILVDIRKEYTWAKKTGKREVVGD